jgi:hypothetical protein
MVMVSSSGLHVEALRVDPYSKLRAVMASCAMSQVTLAG